MTGVSAAETHTALLFFTPDRVYKAKKAVQLPFVDFSTVGARQAACQQEVDLNRRLAPDVYDGVAELVGPDGQVEPLVVMRRLPAARRLSSLVQTGGSSASVQVGQCVDQIADLLVTFHAGAARSSAIDTVGDGDAVAGLWKRNFDELTDVAGDRLDGTVLVELNRLAEAYLAGRQPLFAARVAAGRVCDGHGDLLADDIFCLDDGPRIIDCLEFSDRLRYGDVLADVGFLAMDLERLGRPDLAGRFLARYRAVSGDDWPESLAHFWIAYRALVRAKVACLRADAAEATGAGEAAGAAEAADVGEARSLVALAGRHLGESAVRLVLIGGPPGAGKSSVAGKLGSRFGWAVLSSDRVRKQLAGLDAATPARAPFGRGVYTAERTDQTYGELLARAVRLLEAGQSVILDASWTSSVRRAAARRTARAAHAELVELRCSAPEAVALERARIRMDRGGDASDATPAIARELARRADPWPQAHPVDTAGPLKVAVEDAAGYALTCRTAAPLTRSSARSRNA